MFTSSVDIERKAGRVRLVQCTDDDRDGIPDELVVSDLVASANRITAAILRKKGWTDEQLQKLSTDDFLRQRATLIAIDIMYQRRSEFRLPDGSSIGSRDASTARKDLELVASAELRPAAEQKAGPNPNVAALSLDPAPPFYFAPTADKPEGPGGF